MSRKYFDTECHSCGYPAQGMARFPRGPHVIESEQHMEPLCEFCSHTLIANATRAPQLYPATDQVSVKALAWGLNRLLDEIRGARRDGEEQSA